MNCKKFFLILLLPILCLTVAKAQPRAIGARLGGNIDFSYQHFVLSNNMLDITAGVSNYVVRYDRKTGEPYSFGSIDLTCMFDWVMNITGGLNWYVGPGAGLGFYWSNYHGNTPVKLNVGAQVGLEYQFKIPLNISIDYRPMVNIFGLIPDGDGRLYLGDFYGIALGVRYRFN